MNTVCFGDQVLQHGPNLRIVPTNVDRACRENARGPQLVGQAFAPSASCRKCLHNARYAMCKRHGPPQAAVVRQYVHAKRLLSLVSNETRLRYLEHYSVIKDQWLMKWPEHKRREILRSMWLDTIRPDQVKNMVKLEGGWPPATRPRCIQYYPNLATQAIHGPMFSSLQKAYTDQFQEFCCGDVSVTFGSGLNSQQLGAWMDRAMARCQDKPHFFESDGKSWDGLIQRVHHDLKMLAYSFMDDNFLDFVERGFSVRGYGRYNEGKLAYSIAGTVKSGHNDTTLGNSIVNAMTIFEVMSDLKYKGSIIVAGDDLVVVVDGNFDEHALAAGISDFGIHPEYRKFDDVVDVSFISGVWFPARDGNVFTPKPGRLLSRLFWTLRPPSRKKLGQYNHAIALGLLPTCGGLPVVGAFLRAHMMAGGPEDYNRGIVGSYEHWLRKFRPDISYDGKVVQSFCERYRLTVSDFDYLEKRLMDKAGRVGLWNDDVGKVICDVDCASLLDRPCVGTSYVGGSICPNLVEAHDSSLSVVY